MKTIDKSTLTGINTIEKHAENLANKLAQKEQQIEELEAKVKFYEEQFRLSQAQKYGSSSEKTDSSQIDMFNEPEKLSAQKSEEPDIEEVITKRKAGKSKSKKTFDDLESETIHYELPEDEMSCPTCNHGLHAMKIERRKELKVIPPQVKLIYHDRIVYACRKCDAEGTAGTIVRAPMPRPVILGSMVSPSMLAFIMEKKFNQAQPLYRQEKAWINFGVDISRQNMANWIIKGSNDWLKLLYNRLHEKLLEEPIIHADETPLNVLDEKNNKTNYMWLYASAKHGNRSVVLYDYQPSRANKHPKKFLENFTGFLQTDGYPGYNKISEVTQVGCLAHARRKFDEAIKAAPKDAELTTSKSKEALLMFSRIYKLEKEFKELKPEDRFERRLKESEPIITELKQWLDVESKRTLPKSKLGEAIKYALNQWHKLIAFLEDGRIAVDNNLAERSIKPFVIGRKNWMFSKSPKGATSSAVCYSIIETAKANNLKPFQYLTYLFEELPNINPQNMDELDALLPWSETLPKHIYQKLEES